MDASDLKLVERLLARDRRAFDEFFRSYFQRLYRFAFSRLNHDPTTAEEVVQATLSRAVTKLETFRGQAPLFSWLCTFCRHEISAYLEKSKRASAEVALCEETPEVREALDSIAILKSDDPETALQRQELATQVQTTLDRLPARYGDVLEWKYVEDLSVKQIAARLSVGAKAAESMLTRARQAFRETFGASAEVGTTPGPARVPVAGILDH